MSGLPPPLGISPSVSPPPGLPPPTFPPRTFPPRTFPPSHKYYMFQTAVNEVFPDASVRDASSTFDKLYTERSMLKGSSNTTRLTQTSPFRPECSQQWPLFQHDAFAELARNVPEELLSILDYSRTRILGLSVEGLGEHHASQLQCGPSTTGLLMNSHGQTMLLKAGIRHSGPLQVVTTSTSGVS